MKFRVAKGRASAPLRGAALALLTLCVFNIYPKDVCGEGGPSGNLTVDALFDFEVPSSVIQQGVLEAYGGPGDDYDDQVEGIFERNGWSGGWGDLTEREWEGLDVTTNGMVFVGDTNVGGFNMLVPEGVFTQYGSNLLAGMLNTNVVLPLSNSVPTLPSAGFDTLSQVWTYLSSEAPPEGSAGLPSSPLVNGVFNSGFWVNNLTMRALQNFDGGGLDSTIRNLPSDGAFAWVLPVYVGVCDNIVLFVADHPNGCRPFVRFVCVILYWVALYRYLIKRVVFVIESVFQGTSGGE